MTSLQIERGKQIVAKLACKAFGHIWMHETHLHFESDCDDIDCDFICQQCDRCGKHRMKP